MSVGRANQSQEEAGGRMSSAGWLPEGGVLTPLPTSASSCGRWAGALPAVGSCEQ